ncbi:hypothetical protein KP509_07G082900 [Ceratopteris richardii]|uniref:Uncharacterized protein n=1 Tax=Ceratopteris richardii TaxID=49495 RepID=A0A8T2UE38_CERRI|nr:hypothetical protein KP509_07G082900 [Ceratopteris richardii]
MASMYSFDICTSRNDFYLLAGAMRSFFSVIATEMLACEVDTSTLSQEAPLLPRLLWLLRYFNPLNLSWRFYSIFAYRMLVGGKWGEKQMAIINFEAHPLRPPKPFVVTETIDLYHVRRLDPSGFFSIQGLLTISVGYPAILAVQYTIWTAGVAFLPHITMPLAFIGLFRVLVYPWITGKVYVDPYPYLSSQIMESMPVTPHKANKLVASARFFVISFLFSLSIWSFVKYPSFNLPKQKLSLRCRCFTFTLPRLRSYPIRSFCGKGQEHGPTEFTSLITGSTRHRLSCSQVFWPAVLSLVYLTSLNMTSTESVCDRSVAYLGCLWAQISVAC